MRIVTLTSGFAKLERVRKFFTGEKLMSIVTIIIQHAPYQSDHKAWDALRFAGAALTEDMTVRVHLLDQGVKLASKIHQPPETEANLEQLLNELIECELEVRACGKSLDDFSIAESDMIEGIEKSSMKGLAGWVNSSDHVMTF
jgi:sulfur relay (sulfurtransferase) complex TusBCD TusD component (DsrE family)